MLSHLLNILQYWRCSKQLIRFNLVTTQEGVGHNVGAVPCACPDSSFTPTSKGRHKALPFGGYLNSYTTRVTTAQMTNLSCRDMVPTGSAQGTTPTRSVPPGRCTNRIG